MNEIVLTQSQQYAFEKLKSFIESPNDRVFILKGYAGTGKTTLVRTLIEEMKSQGMKYALLASTGRAAKILSNATDEESKTVHGCIYQFGGFNQDIEKMVSQRERTEVDNTGQLFLNFDLRPNKQKGGKAAIYIVDESSMISDKEDKNATQAVFGSGRLLYDLINFDRSGKFIFVGDVCQLPPITQKISPALNADYFWEVFGIKVSEVELTDIVRQQEGCDIVLSAAKIRNMYYRPQPFKCAKFPLKGYGNIHLVPNQMDLVRMYISEIKNKGYNNSTLLSFSNQQCDTITDVVRPALGIHSDRIAVNDLLLVTQNNSISGLMNGDQVLVIDVGTRERRAGLTFIKVTVEELFSHQTFTQFLIEAILYANQTNLSQPQQKELFIDYYYRMRDRGISQKSKEFKDNMYVDPYLNAIRAVYGYALTCHKAQGGEWRKVFLDIPRSLPYKDKPYVYQWIYTAMTRAKEDLYIVDDYWVM